MNDYPFKNDDIKKGGNSVMDKDSQLQGHSAFKAGVSNQRNVPMTMTPMIRTKVRFGGAQIAITHEVKKNVETIKRAIDWAQENKVEYLVTPEGALSGYYPGFADDEAKFNALIKGEKEVVEYAKSKDVGLCLGTLYIAEETVGKLKRAQIRYYNQNGIFEGSYNKIQCIGSDIVVPGKYLIPQRGDQNLEEFWGHPTVKLMAPKMPQANIVVSSMICNDLYGESEEGLAIARSAMYSLKNRPNPAQLIIHATYGLRGREIHEDLDPEILQAVRDWHRCHIQQLCWFTMSDMLIVDSASNFGGYESVYDTCSPSGVCLKGKYVVKVPSKGEQYFYHDFDMQVTDWDSDYAPEPAVLERMLRNNPVPIEE